MLDQAIGVSDDFLNGGEIVSTRGRHPDDTQRYDAKPGDIADGKPPAVSFVKPSGFVDGDPSSSKLNLFEGSPRISLTR